MKRRLFIYLFKTLFVLYKCCLCVFIHPWIYPKLPPFLSFFAHPGPVLQVGCCPRFWRDTTQLTIGQHCAKCIIFVPYDRETFVRRSRTSGRGVSGSGDSFFTRKNTLLPAKCYCCTNIQYQTTLCTFRKFAWSMFQDKSMF